MIYLEDEIERELTPEEDEEYLYLIKKSISTVLRMSKKDWERFDELSEKKYGPGRNSRKKLDKTERDFINSKKVWVKSLKTAKF